MNNILNNLFSLSYYTAVLSGTKRFRWILATLILALLLSVKPSLFVITKVRPIATNLESKTIALVNEIYPAELEIKIKNGIASSNVTEPYYITARKEIIENILSLKKDEQNSTSKIRLLAIDTKGKAEEFEQYQSLALLTQASLVYYGDKKINIYPLRDIQDMTINKEAITKLLKEYNKKYNISGLLNFGVSIAPLLIVLGTFLSQLSLFFFLTIAVYIMTRINQLSVGFKNSYRYTTAVGFAPIFIWNVISFIPFVARNLRAAGSLLTIIILVIAYLGITRLKKSK